VISYRNLAHLLDVSVGTVSNRVRAGMPTHETRAAAAWCAKLPARKKYNRGKARVGVPNRNNGKPTGIVVDTGTVDLADATLESTIPRLRRIEKLTSDALARATSQDPGGYETTLLRRAHLDSVLHVSLRGETT
jgi:hypothetical protein